VASSPRNTEMTEIAIIVLTFVGFFVGCYDWSRRDSR
jgi:hypothetical protein